MHLLQKILFLCFVFPSVSFAQTVYTKQDTQSENGFGPASVWVFSTQGNPAYAGFYQTRNFRTVCFDINLVDANSSITSFDMGCRTARTNLTAWAAMYVLPVYTATATTGITNATISTIRVTATGGGAPGTSNWNLCVTNIPGPWLKCSFTANGAVTALDDTITINARGITP